MREKVNSVICNALEYERKSKKLNPTTSLYGVCSIARVDYKSEDIEILVDNRLIPKEQWALPVSKFVRSEYRPLLITIQFEGTLELKEAERIRHKEHKVKRVNITNCKNCGAVLHGSVCEYCGTEYNIIQI